MESPNVHVKVQLSPGSSTNAPSPRYGTPQAWIEPVSSSIPKEENDSSGQAVNDFSEFPVERPATADPSRRPSRGSQHQASTASGSGNQTQDRPKTAGRVLDNVHRLHTAGAVPPSANQRKANSQKSEWNVTNNKMRQTERLIEKSLASAATAGQEVATLIESAALESQRSQNAISREIGDRLYCIKQCVSRLSSHVECHNDVGQHYIATLTRLMEQGNMEIASFKEKEREQFEDLSTEEVELSKEVDAFAARLHSWETSNAGPSHDSAAGHVTYTGSGRPPSQSKTIAHDPHQRQPDEVIAFQNFHDNYGPFGGWDEPDHKHFKKILARCAFDYGRCAEVATNEMGELFTRKEIIAHARWDAEYEDLLTRKRVAIQQWRLKKEEIKIDARDLIEADTIRQTRDQQREAAVEREIERREQKQRLEAWKAEKAAKAQAAAEAEQAEEILKARERARERKAKQKAKEAADQAKREKEEALERMRAQERVALAALEVNKKAPRKQPTPEEMEKRARMQERDNQFVVKRLAAVNAKQKQANERKHRQEQIASKVKLTVDSDPHRLLRPTAAVESRLKADPEEPGLFKEKPQHWARAPAGWRAGL
mmetsp:Transcript_43082/g.52245  ORF Transcript_43082/g.52245 Transcript_43082/m.52245 type:complete len:600 (+) Transcript_43082:141-1940(+)|eukprot:CAMPEP_0197861778 /NCGR_PEP_ID=MMETSP1438-20131217/38046_1 /TAXON_ID=1461541 /ORGANISM="Pterosperma sp., Strain CCMP1384" /LENGTH=599 /DNA_ID=CAMNT_0043479075 /DNA_START=117 /DNA_END=1916 /DNA_ORIENTATION=+